jgi:hypothetical protein
MLHELSICTLEFIKAVADTYLLSEIWVSHGGEYEDDCLRS